jgi:hypothetical protein
MISYVEVFKQTKKTLSILGIWVDGDSPKFRNVFSIFYHILYTFISIIFQIVYLWKLENLTVVNSILITATTPMYASVILRISFFVWNQKKLENLLKLIEDLVELDFWIAKTGGVRLKRRSDQVIKIATVQMILIVMAWILGTIVSCFKAEMPSQMWLPYEFSGFFPVMFTIFWQQSAIFIPITAAFIINFLPSLLINLTAGIIEELGERIVKIGSEMSKKKKVTFKDVNEKLLQKRRQNPSAVEVLEDQALEELVKCIEIQVKIKEIVEEINKIFGKITLIEGVLGTLVICTTSYALTTVRSRNFTLKSS